VAGAFFLLILPIVCACYVFQCRGLAAAVLGDPEKVENTGECPWPGIFDELGTRATDVGIYSVTHTTSRTINEKSTDRPLAFSSPYFYDGLVFGGPSAEIVACANRLDTYFGICRSLVVCVLTGSSHYDFVVNRLPLQHIQVHDAFTNVLKYGICNVIGADASYIGHALLAVSGGTDEDFSIGSNVFTQEPMALTTRPDDREWSFFVETFLQGLLEAEAQNVTQANVSMFPSVPYFGSDYESMIAQAVGSIGNFGELYERTIGPRLPREGLNRLRTDNCDDEGGLIYGFPFGGVLDGDPIKDGGGKLGEVVNRRKIRCGVPSIDDASKFHVEICRAVSAALFGGSTDQVEQIPFSVGSTEALYLVSNNQVDILVGVGANSLPMVGSDLKSFTLSKPYLFHPTDEGGVEYFLLATPNDHQWSVFTQWVVMFLINAEEMLISREQGDFSPGLFGPSYDRIFRDVVLAVKLWRNLRAHHERNAIWM
jgi:general L-amino acid transport system substrate-binding protein